MTKLFLIVLAVMVFSACNRKQEVLIENASRDTVFIMKTTVANPTLIRLTVTGYVDDSISINHIKLYKGKIDTTIRR